VEPISIMSPRDHDCPRNMQAAGVNLREKHRLSPPTPCSRGAVFSQTILGLLSWDFTQDSDSGLAHAVDGPCPRVHPSYDTEESQKHQDAWFGCWVTRQRSWSTGPVGRGCRTVHGCPFFLRKFRIRIT